MPRLRVNYKFTVLHTRIPSVSESDSEIQNNDNNNDNINSDGNNKIKINSNNNENNENNDNDNNENKIESNENKRIFTTEEIEDEERAYALLKLTVTNGKVRRILDSVLAIQSWPYGSKKEPNNPDLTLLQVIF